MSYPKLVEGKAEQSRNSAGGAPRTGDAYVWGMAEPKGYVGVLDLLRGGAALAVVLFHFSLPGGEMQHFYTPLLLTLFRKGFLGVHVFFVISGFVLPLSLWAASYRLADFWPYLRRRAVRLLPPAYASLLLVLAVRAVADGMIHHRWHALATLSVGQVLSNLLLVAPYSGHSYINGVFWTLEVEFQYYLVLGLLFPLLFGPGRFWLFLWVHLAIFAAGLIPGLYVQNYLHFSPLFTMGSLTFLFHQGRLPLRPYLLALALFAGLTGVNIHPEQAIVATATALVIAFVKANHPVFKFFGTISYSVYLTHVVVGGTVNFILARLVPHASAAVCLAVVALAVALSTGCATLFNRWIEQPFLRLSRVRPK